MYFQWPRNSIRGLTNVISGHFLVHFRWNFCRKKHFWDIFITPKNSSLNFRGTRLGESLQPFLSYPAHFRRYKHFTEDFSI